MPWPCDKAVQGVFVQGDSLKAIVGIVKSDSDKTAAKKKGRERTSLSSEQSVIDRRRMEVADLMLGGASQREIAEQLGVSAATINGDIRAIRSEWVKSTKIKLDVLIAQDLRRLDMALSAIMTPVLAGNLEAIETFLKIIQSRATIIGYPGLWRVEHDEAQGRTNGRSSAPAGAGAAPPLSADTGLDMRILQGISQLSAEGRAVFIQNMMLAAGLSVPTPPVIIENVA